MQYPLNSPLNHKKDHQKLNYYRFYVRNYAVSKCVLMRINRTTNCTIPLPYRYDVGTLGDESFFY